jgi:CubicO group peptidase (beta-lactamase class C family)
VPNPVVKDIEGAKGPYHHQWWLSSNEHDAYFALGYGGQILYINPLAQLVVAKFSSYPTPVEGGREFFHTFTALPALANELMK